MLGIIRTSDYMKTQLNKCIYLHVLFQVENSTQLYMQYWCYVYRSRHPIALFVLVGVHVMDNMTGEGSNSIDSM